MSIKKKGMNQVDRDCLDSNKVRIRLGQMYLVLKNGSKALHHLNIVKELQNRTSNTFILDGADLNVLIAEAQEHIPKDINIH